MDELNQDLSNKKIFIWEDHGFFQFATSYFLQKKINCKLYALFDTTNRTKLFFKNQKLTNFEKSWFLHEHIKKNKKPDFEYLSLIEKKYDLNLWLLAANERIFYDFYNYHKFSENEVMSIIEQECRLFEQILDDVKPDFLMITTNLHQNYIFYKICEAKGVHILFLTTPRLSGRCMISNKADTLPVNLDSKPLKHELSFIELENYQKKHSKFKDTKNFLSGFSSSKYYLLKAAIEFLFLSDNSNEKTHFTYYGRTKFRVLINSINDALKTHFREKFIEKFFSKTIPDLNFVFYPLHLEPEQTLLINAPFFTNQLEIIRNIVKSLPLGYKLLVKEQSAMVTRNWREIGWYKQLMQIPNVILIHPSLPPDELLKKCSLVITINGSAGFDAAFFGKPSIVFRDVVYSKLSCVTVLKTIEHLPQEIRNSINKKPDLHELNEFINLLENNSFKFEWNKFSSNVLQDIFLKGNLVDVEVSDNEIQIFLNKNKELLSPLVDQYIKTINYYVNLETTEK
jgi:hypothetical protein